MLTDNNDDDDGKIMLVEKVIHRNFLSISKEIPVNVKSIEKKRKIFQPINEFQFIY